MTRITNKFIKENYDLDVERQSFTQTREVDSFTNEISNLEGELLSAGEFLEKMNSFTSKIKENQFVEIKNYGYNGGMEFIISEKINVPESDTEVIERLKKFERTQRNKIREIEKAKELLASV